ncbi:hypothetical protein D3C80_1144690 [compost metagenome]
MDHAQAEQLLAGRAALVEDLEQHHVPPVEQEQQDQAQADPQFAEPAEHAEYRQRQGRAQRQVDGEGTRAGQRTGRAQQQIDPLRGFHPQAGIQQRGGGRGGWHGRGLHWGKEWMLAGPGPMRQLSALSRAGRRPGDSG